MAVRDDFAAGEVLAAADLNDTFAEKLPYSYGTATPSTSDDGFLWYDSNSTPPEVKFWDGAAFQALTSGKILQIVRATDSTDRTTSSATYVDANLSVTITPNQTSNYLLLITSSLINTTGGNKCELAITDASNNVVSGAERAIFGDNSTNFRTIGVVIGYSTPATTSAVTYKLRFLGAGGNAVQLENSIHTGQMYAIEVSA